MTAPIRPDVTQVARPRRSWLDRLREGLSQESAGIPAVAPDVTAAPRPTPRQQPTIGPGRSGLERAAATVEAGMDDAALGIPGYALDALAAAVDPRRTFADLRTQRAERKEKVDPALLMAMGVASAPEALVGKSRSLLDLLKKQKGFTLGTRSGRPLVQGYSVGAGAMRNAALPEAERLALSSKQGMPMSQIRPDDIEEVVARIQKDKDNALGGWWNEESDMGFVEPATQSLHLPPTFARGMERGEQGIGNLRKYAAQEDGFIAIPKKLDDGTFGDYDLGADYAGLRPYFGGDPTKTASWLTRTGWRGASGREADIALAEAINQLMRQRK